MKAAVIVTPFLYGVSTLLPLLAVKAAVMVTPSLYGVLTLLPLLSVKAAVIAILLPKGTHVSYVQELSLENRCILTWLTCHHC